MMQSALSILLFVLVNVSFAQTESRTRVYFDKDSYALKKNTVQTLDSLIGILKTAENYKLEIVGHTDNTDADEYNMRLSKSRANEVLNYLEKSGLIRSSANISFFGEEKQLNANASAQEQAMNRRVEIICRISPKKIDQPVTEEKIESPKYIKLPSGAMMDAPGIPGMDIELVRNTDEMEKNNMVTMTADGEPIFSNMVFCVRTPPGGPCTYDPGIYVYVPVSTNPYCSGPAMRAYDATSGGTIRWNLLDTTLTVIVHDGQEFFKYYIRSVCPPCKNIDCKAKKAKSDSIYIKPSYYAFERIINVYPNANAIMEGHKAGEKICININPVLSNKEEHFIKLYLKGKNKEYMLMQFKIDQLKFKKRKELYVIRKKDIKKFGKEIFKDS